MKRRYKALGVPKTPVFICQTTKMRPMKPRRETARETMSRNARRSTRACNTSTEHSPSLKDSAACGVPQANTSRTDFVAICEPASTVTVSGRPRGLRDAKGEREPFDVNRAGISDGRSRRDTARRDAGLARLSRGTADDTTRAGG